MSQLWVGEADAGTNQPGGAVCPRWLLLLDDPDPRHVLVIGNVRPELLEWFDERGAEVQVRSLADGADVADVADVIRETTPMPLVDLVVVDHDPAVSRHHAGHARLTAAARSRFPPSVPVVGVGSSDGASTVVHTAGATRLLRTTDGTVISLEQHRLDPAVTASPHAPPPAWLQATVRSWTPEVGTWSLRIPDAYPSQKAVAMVSPKSGTGRSVVVKVTRHPRFNPRLDNEYAHLREGSGAVPVSPDRRVPDALDATTVAGLRAVVETTVDGRPFLEVSRLGPRCRLAEDAAAVITRLGEETRQYLPGATLAEPLDDLLGRFVDRFTPEPDVVTHLQRQVTLIGQAGLPLVLFHGDLGTWNLLAAEDRVFILDWESAVDPGPALWDLAYFFRSYIVRSGRRYGMRRNFAIRRHLLGTSRLNAVGAHWFAAYRRAIGIDADLGAALFHTCWMHRAVKESLRLPPGTSGHYGPLCSHLVLHRRDPGLSRLLGT